MTVNVSWLCNCDFFFQAEDGIRDIGVTGVQTCALPIYHELRVDRRSTDVAIERCQLLAQVSQHLHYDRIDPAQEMARRNAPFEVEQIEQLALIARLPTHHGKPPPLNVSSDGITVRRKSRALFQQYRPGGERVARSLPGGDAKTRLDAGPQLFHRTSLAGQQ